MEKGLQPIGFLQFFADGGSAEGSQTTDAGANEDVTNPPVDDPDNSNPDGKSGDEEETFSQEQLNAIASRENKKGQNKILKELGIANINDAKEGLAAFKEWQENQKTNEQKLNDAIEEHKNKSQSLEEENGTLKASLAAMKLDVNADSLGDVLVLAQAKTSDEVTIEEAIEEVLNKYPHFKKTQEEATKPKPQIAVPKKKEQELSDAEKWEQAFKSNSPFYAGNSNLTN